MNAELGRRRETNLNNIRAHNAASMENVDMRTEKPLVGSSFIMGALQNVIEPVKGRVRRQHKHTSKEPPSNKS